MSLVSYGTSIFWLLYNSDDYFALAIVLADVLTDVLTDVVVINTQSISQDFSITLSTGLIPLVCPTHRLRHASNSFERLVAYVVYGYCELMTAAMGISSLRTVSIIETLFALLFSSFLVLHFHWSTQYSPQYWSTQYPQYLSIPLNIKPIFREFYFQLHVQDPDLYMRILATWVLNMHACVRIDCLAHRLLLTSPTHSVHRTSATPQTVSSSTNSIHRTSTAILEQGKLSRDIKDTTRIFANSTTNTTFRCSALFRTFVGLGWSVLLVQPFVGHSCVGQSQAWFVGWSALLAAQHQCIEIFFTGIHWTFVCVLLTVLILSLCFYRIAVNRLILIGFETLMDTTKTTLLTTLVTTILISQRVLSSSLYDSLRRY